MKPTAEYGIMTSRLTTDEIKSILAKQFKTTEENVHLSTEVNATVISIVKYEEDL